jgi:hypothetical protein
VLAEPIVRYPAAAAAANSFLSVRSCCPCRLYLEGLTSKPQQLSELVLSLDEAYSKFLTSQVRHMYISPAQCARATQSDA